MVMRFIRVLYLYFPCTELLHFLIFVLLLIVSDENLLGLVKWNFWLLRKNSYELYGNFIYLKREI